MTNFILRNNTGFLKVWIWMDYVQNNSIYIAAMHKMKLYYRRNYFPFCNGCNGKQLEQSGYMNLSV
jgi:hypothetical protein